MVAYRKLTKDERQSISRKMEILRFRKEIDERVNKVTEEIEKALWDEIPNDVKEFYNKYPQYVDMCEYTLSGYNLFDNKELDSHFLYNYSDPSFRITKILNNFYNDFNGNKYYSVNNHPFILYLKEHYPAWCDKCREIVLDSYKIFKWKEDVLCVLNNITTVNKLKNEFPEAYNAYVSVYGNPENDNDDCIKTDHTTGKKMNMCDAIEKVRAEFNNSSK